MLFKEMIAAYSENHVKPTKTKCIVTDYQTRWYICYSHRLALKGQTSNFTFVRRSQPNGRTSHVRYNTSMGCIGLIKQHLQPTQNMPEGCRDILNQHSDQPLASKCKTWSLSTYVCNFVHAPRCTSLQSLPVPSWSQLTPNWLLDVCTVTSLTEATSTIRNAGTLLTGLLFTSQPYARPVQILMLSPQ
jgi:hypothetical protein